MHAAQRAGERGGDGVRALAALLFQAAILAYALLGLLHLPAAAGAVLAAAAGCNLLALVALRWARADRVVHVLAPLWGVTAWAGLIRLTGGVGVSPFVAGLWFEVVLAAICSRPAGILWVSALGAAALPAQQIGLAATRDEGALALQASLLVLVGAATALVRHRLLARQRQLSATLQAQDERLTAIQASLADARALAAVGEQAARLGHGLKNAVHSLRGFAALIERRLGGSEGREALDGLRAAIDGLESLARDTLKPAPGAPPAPLRGPDLVRAVRDCAAELCRSFPGVRCRVEGAEEAVAIAVPGDLLREVMSNLLRNAAEAMAGRGAVTVRIAGGNDRCEIDVTDEGPGISSAMRDQLFRPGRSGKPDGHGMGLYIVRRLMERTGGEVCDLHGPRGATFRVAWPKAQEA